jgi:hypothetical protein
MDNIKLPKCIYQKAKTFCITFEDGMEFDKGITILNNLKRHLKYQFDGTDIEGNIVMCVSEYKHGGFYIPMKIETGVKGRPKKVAFEFKKIGSLGRVNPHIHGIINVNKSNKISKAIRDYSNKLQNKKTVKFNNIDESKGGYGGSLNYMTDQTDKFRTVELE